MKNANLMIKLLVIQCLAFVCLAQDFDFFYFVQQVLFGFRLLIIYLLESQGLIEK